MTYSRVPIALASLTLLGLSGCSHDPEPPAPCCAVPTVDTFEGEPLPDLTTSELDLDGDLGVMGITHASAVGDVAVVNGTDEEGRDVTSAFDMGTGKTLWTDGDIPETLDVPGSGTVRYEGEDGWAIEVGDTDVHLVDYRRMPCSDLSCEDYDARGMTEEQGIAALSLDYHTPVWTAPVVPSFEENSEEALDFSETSPTVVAATDELVIVNLDGGQQGTHTSDEHMSTMALDARTGETLWSVDRTFAQFLSGDTVLAYTEDTLEDSPANRLVAFDATTGKEKFRVAEEAVAGLHAGGRWLGGAGDLAAAAVSTNDGLGQIVDLSDGTLGSPVHGQPAFGSDSSGDFAAWTSKEFGEDIGPASILESVGLSDAAPRDGEHGLDDDYYTSAVADGYLWAHTSGDAVVAFDRTGAVRSEPLAGFPQFVADGLVLTDGGAEDTGVHAYTYGG